MNDTDSSAVVGFVVGIIATLVIVYVAIPSVGIAVDEMNKYRASDDYLQGYNVGLTSCHDYLKSNDYSISPGVNGWNYWMYRGYDIKVVRASQMDGYNAGLAQCDKVKTLERDLYMACRLRQPQAADLVTTAGIYPNGTRIEKAYDWGYTCRGTVYHGDDQWQYHSFEPVAIDPTEFNKSRSDFPNITFSQLRSEAL